MSGAPEPADESAESLHRFVGQVISGQLHSLSQRCASGRRKASSISGKVKHFSFFVFCTTETFQLYLMNKLSNEIILRGIKTSYIRPCQDWEDLNLKVVF